MINPNIAGNLLYQILAVSFLGFLADQILIDKFELSSLILLKMFEGINLEGMIIVHQKIALSILISHYIALKYSR